jgi:DNA recombination protein RmuC
MRKQAVDRLVEPLAKSLDKVEMRILDLEKQRVGAYQGLQEQIAGLLRAQDNLHRETAQLSGALRSPSARGRWGELQLRRIVELAGMLSHCDFYEQSGTRDGEGRQLRPDMVVRLPGQRSIVIDAKVPLQAYLEASESDDEQRRRELMKTHAMHLRRQVTALSQKSYWDQLEGSPDFVLLFLPGESFYSSALQADPSLIELGLENRVLIATPTTLIALLRTTAYAWRQEDVALYAEEIGRLGRELYQRLADLSGHAVDLGKTLNGSVEAYNRMLGTLESRVLVTARRFHEMKADDPKKMVRDLIPIDDRTRPMQAPDLLQS